MDTATIIMKKNSKINYAQVWYEGEIDRHDPFEVVK